MIPYVILFIIIIVNSIVIEKCFNNKNMKLAKFMAFISMIEISIIAGFRNNNVGRDIDVYVYPLFRSCLTNNLYTLIKDPNIEPLFLIILFVNTKLLGDYHLTLFVIEFVTVFSIYFYGFKNYKNVNFTILISVFLFVFFNNTLVMMRQFVSVSLIFISTHFFKEKKYIKTILLFLLALAFHDTAIISLIIYVFIFLEYSFSNSSNKLLIVKIFTLIVAIFVVLFGDKLVYYFTFYVPILPERFFRYFSSSYIEEGLHFSIINFTFKILVLIMAIIINNKKKSHQSNLAVSFILIDILIYLLSLRIEPILRLGYYFTIISYSFVIPSFGKIIVENRKYKPLFYYTLTIVLFLYWWYIFIHSNGITYPYSSDMLTNFINNIV